MADAKTTPFLLLRLIQDTRIKLKTLRSTSLLKRGKKSANSNKYFRKTIITLQPGIQLRQFKLQTVEETQPYSLYFMLLALNIVSFDITVKLNIKS